MNRTTFLSFFLIVFLLAILSQVLWILSPFFEALFWATVLAFAFYPLHVQIRKLLRGHEGWSALATSLVVFLTFVPLMIFLTWNLASESVKLYHDIQEFVQQKKHIEMITNLRSVPFVHRLEEIVMRFEPLRSHYREWFVATAKRIGEYAGSQAGSFAGSILLAPFNLLLTFFLVFFLLRDGSKIYQFFYAVIPMEDKDKRDVLGQITGSFEAVIRGQILAALAQAVLSGVIFWALGLPLPVLFAALTFVAALIPVLGAPLIWFPFVVYLAFHQLYMKATILFLLGTFGISLVDNFLKPVLIGEKTKLPYLLLFLGILGGMQVYGLIGVFLAPVMLSLFFVLVKMYREKFF